MNLIFKWISLFFVLFLFSGCHRIDRSIEEELLSGGEYWEQLTIDGKPIGFQQTALSWERVEGADRLRFELKSRIIVLRHADRYDVAMELTSFSRPDGSFVESQSSFDGGSGSAETACRVLHDRLEVSSGSSRSDRPWSFGSLGPEAMIVNLLKNPILKSGERRSIDFFDPNLLSLIRSEIVSEQIERIDGIGRLIRLSVVQRRVDAKGQVVDPPIMAAKLWCDAGGNVIRSEIPFDARRIVARRVDKQTALSSMNESPSVELGSLGVVGLARPIDPARRLSRLTFIVQLKDDSPGSRFPSTPFQKIEVLDPNTARITVWAACGESQPQVQNSPFAQTRLEASPTALGTGRLIDLDDPLLTELADSIDCEGLSTWQIAVALEKTVRLTITQSSFSVAFASSHEILRSGAGDCTEYAVLLTALCRKKGIPARVALGLLYTPFRPETAQSAEAGMVFHLWNEVLIDGVWYPLDSTLAQGGADAGRIKITDDDLSLDSPVPLCQSIIDLIGKMSIESR